MEPRALSLATFSMTTQVANVGVLAVDNWDRAHSLQACTVVGMSTPVKCKKKKHDIKCLWTDT